MILAERRVGATPVVVKGLKITRSGSDSKHWVIVATLFPSINFVSAQTTNFKPDGLAFGASISRDNHDGHSSFSYNG